MQIRLLGPVEIVDGEKCVAVAGKQRRVLALLAIHSPERVSEEYLIEALWGEDPPRTGRRTVHGYVSRLRRALSASDTVRIETVQGGYRLIVAPGGIDVGEVRVLVHDAAAAGGAGDVPRALRLLADAESRWRGESLGDLAHEPALQAEAHRLDAFRISIVENRVEVALNAGCHRELTAELELLTASNPLRERLWHARILALYRSGRQADALRVYQELRVGLLEELGIEPSPELHALETAVLCHDPALAWSSAAPAPGPAPSEPMSSPPPTPAAAAGGATLEVPLPRTLARRSVLCVGRREELGRLMAAWQRCQEGQPSLVLLGGAPGVGKTRLAAELAQAAHRATAVVLYGTCDEGIVAPYQPFVEALTHLAGAASPAALRTLLGEGAGELPLLVPDLARVLPELPERTVTEPETERFRLFQAVTGWIEATAAASPVVLILDDLHWAGSATLLMLRHLVAHLGSSRVCIVANYRDSELAQNATLTEVLAALWRREEVQRISVEGLDASGSRELVAVTSGGGMGDEERRLAGMVHAETRGNPFFIQQVLRHLVDTGMVSIDAGGQWVGSSSVTSLGLPEGVRQVVRRRLLLLPPDTRSVLAAASVIGQDFLFDVLAGVVGADGLPDALEAAVSARLLEEMSDARVLRYRFTHALVQATLYRDLSGPRRTRLHAQVAEAYKAFRGDRLDAYLPELAHHYVEAAPAGHVVEALRSCRRAGDEALARLAFEAAEKHYRTGIDLMGTPGGPSRDRAELLIGLAEARFRSGQPEYRRSLEDAWRLVAELEVFDLALRAALACSRGYWGNFVSVDEGRVAALELALGLCRPDDDLTRARLQADMAAELIWDPGRARYTQLADEALTFARRAEDPVTLATVIARRLTTFWDLDRSAERQALAIEGLELATVLGDPVLQVQFATYGIFCAVESADADRLDPLKNLLDELTPTLGQPVWEYSIHYAMMNYWTVRGVPADLQRCLDKALDLGTRLGLPEAPFLAMCESGDIHWWRDTYDEVVDAVEAIVDDFEGLTTMQTWLASILARTGRREQAQGILHHFARSNFDVGSDHSEGIALAECALAAADLGDAGVAQALIGRLAPYVNLVLRNPINAAGPTEWFLARLHVTLGHAATADAAFERAMATSERMGALMWLAHIHCDWAEVLLARDDDTQVPKARQLATVAANLAEQLDLPGIGRRAARVLSGGGSLSGPEP